MRRGPSCEPRRSVSRCSMWIKEEGRFRGMADTFDSVQFMKDHIIYETTTRRLVNGELQGEPEVSSVALPVNLGFGGADSIDYQSLAPIQPGEIIISTEPDPLQGFRRREEVATKLVDIMAQAN